MKQATLAALLSTALVLTALGLLAQLAPGAIIHWLGGVTKQEFDEFRDRTVQEGIPCYIWQRGRDGSDNASRLGSSDGSISLAPGDASRNVYWHFTVLRK